MNKQQVEEILELMNNCDIDPQDWKIELAQSWLEQGAELEQARVDKVIDGYSSYSRHRNGAPWKCRVQSAVKGAQYFQGHDELEPLRAACAYVADLRKPALPDVAEMSIDALVAELNERGADFYLDSISGIPMMVIVRRGFPYYCGCNETPENFWRRAVAAARECQAE